MKHLPLFSVILLLFSFSCKEPVDNELNYNFTGKGIFICNEGNFTYGNASLSYFDLTENKMYNDVFSEVNNFPLGDVAQSITIFENKAYISVNNSGKVYIIDKSTFKYIAEISGLTSPRNIYIKNSEKAYISDLYSPNITIFNPSTYEIKDYINLGCCSEQFIEYQDYLYVLSWSFNNKIFKINSNDEIIDSLEVAYQPNSFVIDKNNILWVLSDGGNEGDENQTIPALTKVSLLNFEIDTVLYFNTINTSPSHLCINSEKNTIYYLNNSWGSNSDANSGIYKFSIDDSEIPENPFITQDDNNLYSFILNPETSEIFVSDALSFSENGKILRYSSTGQLISEYEAGIIPGNFCLTN